MILSELKRRNVLREVGAYSIIAWVLLQVADVVIEPLDWPFWVMSALTYVAMFGVVATFIFAWRYDVTMHGIVRTAPRSSEAEHHPVRGTDYALMALLVAVVIAAGYGMIGQLKLQHPDIVEIADVELPANGVAVLPFLNLSGDPENEYFSDGLADTVLHMLAQIPQLKVTARTSSFTYKGRNEDIRVIGRQLNVRNVLEGSVQFSGERIRVIAQLIDATDGSHLWSKTFDRQTEDVFSIQDEIAQEVARAMQSTVAGIDANDVSHGTSNIDAYREYLLGVQAYNLRTSDGWRDAIEHFEKAIELDPNYVLAYVGIADTLLDPDLHAGRLSERIDEVLDIALSLDPESPDALASKGIRLKWGGGVEDAEHHVMRALEKNPNLIKAYNEFGWLLGHHEARLEESLAMAQKAIELDPIARLTNFRLAEAYQRLNDTENAVRQYLKVVEYYPDYPKGYEGLSNIAMIENRLDSSLRFMLRASELDPGSSWFHEMLSVSYLELGDVDNAQEQLDIARQIADTDELIPDNWYYGLWQMNIHMETGNYAQAEVIVNDWLNNNPWWLARVTGSYLLSELGRYDEARMHLEKAADSSLGSEHRDIDRRNVWIAIQFAEALQWTGGPQDKIDFLLDESLRVLQSTPSLSTDVTEVWIYLIRGENDRALDLFEEQVRKGWRGPGSRQLLPKWQHDPYAPLRGNPRFEELVKIVLDDVERMRLEVEERPELNDSDYQFRGI